MGRRPEPVDTESRALIRLDSLRCMPKLYRRCASMRILERCENMLDRIVWICDVKLFTDTVAGGWRCAVALIRQGGIRANRGLKGLAATSIKCFG